MSHETPLFVIHLLGFVSFLWHGLYVLTRGRRDRISRLTGITAIVTSALFLTGGIEEAIHLSDSAQRIAFARADWLFSVVPAALWLHVSLRLNPRAHDAPWRRGVIVAAYASGVLLVILGSGTDLIRGYHATGSLYTAGPLYLLYVVFVVACAGFAVVNLTQMRTPASPNDEPASGTSSTAIGPYPSEVRMLILGACCFLVGVGYFTFLQILGNTDARLEAPAWALLLVGLAAVGGTVGVQSNLLLGRDMRRDFLYNFCGLLILILPVFVVLTAVIGLDSARSRFLALLLGGLVAIGHTLYDIERLWLDKLFFTPVVQEERAAARAYVEALASPPVGLNPDLDTRKAFDDAVRRALTHLSDPTKMATSPLLNLKAVERIVVDAQQEDNRLNRAAALKEMVLELLEGLRPADRAGGVAGDAYRFYNCLYFPYVQGISRRRAPAMLRQLQERRRRDGSPRSDLERIVEWLMQVDEDTFYKWQRRGSDTIAAALRERERAAGGSVPVETPISLAVAGRQARLSTAGTPAEDLALE